MEAQGLDPSGRSARLVPVVLPLLSGAPARGRCAPDQALEGDPAPYQPDQEELRARRRVLPAAPAPGAVALGLRQSQDLSRLGKAMGAIREFERDGWQVAASSYDGFAAATQLFVPALLTAAGVKPGMRFLDVAC